MRMPLLFCLTCLFSQLLFGQNSYLGLAASIHRYDQVIGLKYVQSRQHFDLGAELGIGVERTLQGAIAPQVALFFSTPLPFEIRHDPIKLPYCILRYQFDFQNAGFLDTYHGLYFGLGYAFGSNARLNLQFSLGLVAEQMYGVVNPIKTTHFFWNPQAQISYFLGKQK
jgi:hypothetical protein